MISIYSFLAGLIFSIGLSISGMVDPNIVIGFLDILGKWNPALLFVMAGAVAVNLILFILVKKRGIGFGGVNLDIPTNTVVDKKLVIGSALFGIGWGIFGVCPGPAIANIFLLNGKMIVFILSMLSGMLVYKVTSET